MKVKVLFFGATADSVGKREMEVSLEQELSAEKAFSHIFESLPSLKSSHEKKSLHFSVNQAYSTGAETIKEGDELAIFTAVSGG